MIKILLLALFCNTIHAASAPDEFAADQLPCGITNSQLTKLISRRFITEVQQDFFWKKI